MSQPQRPTSRFSFPTVDTDSTYESEAQRRGIYGSPTSGLTHIGNYELKRPADDEAAERSIKRRRNAEEDRESCKGYRRSCIAHKLTKNQLLLPSTLGAVPGRFRSHESLRRMTTYRQEIRV